jgi:CheY-like chemotaxis protein
MVPRRRVLVVEDDLLIRGMVAEVLAEEGYLVDLASHGAEALDCARRALPDVVLLDLNLPVMDGWQFRDALRRMDGGDTPRLILMTADHRAAVKAERVGARSYLEKPFDLDDMLALVSSAARAA